MFLSLSFLFLEIVDHKILKRISWKTILFCKIFTINLVVEFLIPMSILITVSFFHTMIYEYSYSFFLTFIHLHRSLFFSFFYNFIYLSNLWLKLIHIFIYYVIFCIFPSYVFRISINTFSWFTILFYICTFYIFYILCFIFFKCHVFNFLYFLSSFYKILYLFWFYYSLN